jgi:hypothetical protein
MSRMNQRLSIMQEAFAYRLSQGCSTAQAGSGRTKDQQHPAMCACRTRDASISSEICHGSGLIMRIGQLCADLCWMNRSC